MITCELFFFFLRNIDSVLILLSIYRSVWDVFSVFHFQCSQMRFCKVITASNLHASAFFAESTVNIDENQNTKKINLEAFNCNKMKLYFFCLFCKSPFSNNKQTRKQFFYKRFLCLCLCPVLFHCLSQTQRGFGLIEDISFWGFCLMWKCSKCWIQAGCLTSSPMDV